MKDLDLFANAPRDVSPEDLEAYLDEACRSDHLLRAKVKAMLAAEQQMGDLLKVRPLSESSTLTDTETVGTMIGNYKLLQEIGHGGFGTVYMADQLAPVRRRVALKIIKLGMDTKQVVARFEAERQALAMMDHPNIAKVYDAGTTETGRPFFVMELVNGIPITQFCDEHKLHTRERLSLFGEVCRAIQHAHQQGIIHRDIKPSNVLVALQEDKPIPKVIDFGIAKATQGTLTDLTLFTGHEQLLGTPAYMSPEQATASPFGIDTRSDVYSLGVLLYELLTGRPPFDTKTLLQAGYDEMRRMIREVDPPKPSTRLSTLTPDERELVAKSRGEFPEKLPKEIAGELDWIVLKAMEKDRTRRYETVNALARDIERFFANEPLEAAAPNAAYHFKKFARRNKAALLVTSLITTILVLATTVSIWLAIIADKRLKDSEIARKESEELNEFLIDVLQGADPKLDNKGRGSITIVELLDKATVLLEEKLADQPARKAKLKHTIAFIYYNVGERNRALPLSEAAQRYFNAHPETEDRIKLANTKLLSMIYSSVNRQEEGLQMKEQAVALSTRVNGPDHQDTLRLQEELSRQIYFANGPVHPDSAQALEKNLAVPLNEAAQELQELQLNQQLIREDGKTEAKTAILNKARKAIDEAKLDKWEESLELLNTTLEESRTLNGPDHLQTLAIANAHVLVLKRNPQAAIESAGQVLAMRRKILGSDHPQTIRCMRTLVEIYFHTQQIEKAIAQQEEIVALERRLGRAEDSSFLKSLANLGSLYRFGQRYDEAVNALEELVSIRRNGNWHHRATLDALASLAINLRSSQRYERAAETLKDLLMVNAVVFANGPSTSLGFVRREAEELAIRGDWMNASRFYQVILDDGIDTHSHDWMRAVVLLRQLDHQDAHEQYAKRFMDRFLSSEQADDVERAVKSFLVSPSAATSPLFSTARDAARQIADDEPHNAYYAMVDGLARYRSGQFSEALEVLERSNIAGTAAIKAMATHEEGKAETAKRFLTQARYEHLLGFERTISQTQLVSRRQTAVASIGSDWIDRLIGNLLLEEAEKMITGNSTPPLLPQFSGFVRECVKAESDLVALQLSEKLQPSKPSSGNQEPATVFCVNETNQDRDLLIRGYGSSWHPVIRIEAGATYKMNASVNSVWQFARTPKEPASSFTVTSALSKVVIPRSTPTDQGEPLAGIVAQARERFADMLGLSPKRRPDFQPPQAVADVLIPPTSEWRWLHPVDGIDPAQTDADFHKTFYASDFDDSKWNSGTDSPGPNGGFGYGEEDFNGVDIGTPATQEQAFSGYFRCRFETIKTHANLELRLQRDDGIIVYLNGKAVQRDNVAPGIDAYHLQGENTVSNDDETRTYRYPILGSLEPGSHVLAISVHNKTPSSDLRLGAVTLVELAPMHP